MPRLVASRSASVTDPPRRQQAAERASGQSKRHEENVLAAFDALLASPSAELSTQRVKAATAAVMWMAGEPASVWLPPRLRVALLTLYALSVRKGLSDPERELHGQLHSGLAQLLTKLLEAPWLTDPTHNMLRAAAEHATRLALRTDALPACSALLAALTADPQRLPRGTQLKQLARLPVSFLTAAGSLLGAWAIAPPGSSCADAHDTLAALASSYGLEHSMRALLTAADRTTAASCLAGAITCCDGALLYYDADGHSCDGAADCLGCANDRSIRALLSGPCLQYALAAHTVAQLAAADGGSVYGRARAQMLPPQFAQSPPAGSGGPASGGQRHPRRRLLLADGLVSAMKLWGRCLRLGWPLVAVRRRPVHVLSMRLVRVVTRSAAEHAATRLQAQQQQQAAQGAEAATASAAAPPLAAPLPEAECLDAAVEALRCAALSMRPQPVLYGTPPGEPYALSASQTEGLAEFWAAAVPALNAVIDCCLDMDSWWRLQGALEVYVPAWPDTGLPTPLPPPNLYAALAAGYLPCLERMLRSLGHAAASKTGEGGRVWRWTSAQALISMCPWPRLGRLLAYGETRQAAALLATGGKLIRLLERDAAPAGSSGGAGGRDAGMFPATASTAAKVPLVEMLGSLGSCAGGQPPGGAQLAPGAVGPSRQLAHMLVRAARHWLPASAHVALALLRAPRGSGGGGGSGSKGLAAACHIAQWVPALVQAHLLSRGAGGGAPPQGSAASGGSLCLEPAVRPGAGSSDGAAAAAADGGPCEWRQLLLLDIGVLELLGAALRAALQCAGLDDGSAEAGGAGPGGGSGQAAAGGGGEAGTGGAAAQEMPLPAGGADPSHNGGVGAEGEAPEGAASGAMVAEGRGSRGGSSPLAGDAERALPVLSDALACVAAAFPREVAAAVRSGTLAPLGADSALRAEQRLSPPGLAALRSLREALEVPSSEDPLAADRTHEGARCMAGREGMVCASSREMGAALLAAAQPPDDWPALRACGHPGCMELAGASEAALPLRACGRCGAVWYCSGQCQRAHWAQGHRQACGRRR